MTYKKIKNELAKAFNEKDIFNVSDEDFRVRLADFIYIEKQKSFWFGIFCLLVICPAVIFGLLYLIEKVIY